MFFFWRGVVLLSRWRRRRALRAGAALPPLRRRAARRAPSAAAAAGLPRAAPKRSRSSHSRRPGQTTTRASPGAQPTGALPWREAFWNGSRPMARASCKRCVRIGKRARAHLFNGWRPARSLPLWLTLPPSAEDTSAQMVALASFPLVAREASSAVLGLCLCSRGDCGSLCT